VNRSDAGNQGRDDAAEPNLYLPLLDQDQPIATPFAPAWALAQWLLGVAIVAVLASFAHWIWINRAELAELISLIFSK
jgi:hypothetical protein